MSEVMTKPTPRTLVLNSADTPVLLDVLGTTEQLGKPAGADEGNAKATFVKLLGVEGAREKAAALVASAQARLDSFRERADLLRQTAIFVVERRS